MKVITIGRDSANEITVADPKASRTHLQLVMDDNGNVFVVDLNSTNGTYINGQRITGQTPLRPGDTLRIGDTNLPWQSYLQASPVRTPISTPAGGQKTSISGGGGGTPISNQAGGQPSSGSGKNKPLIWIIAVAAVVIIALGIGLVLLFNNDENSDGDSNGQGTEAITGSNIKSVPDPVIKSDPDPDPNTGDPKPKPKPSQLDKDFNGLVTELRKPENQQWKDAVINALKDKNYDINPEKFKTYTDKQKKEIIDIIKKEKSKIVALTETTQVKDSTDNGSIIATDGNSTSTGGGSSSNNATNGNGTNGVNSNGNGNNTNSSVTTKDKNIDKEFNDLVIGMSEKDAKEFCTNRYYYNRYKIKGVLEKKYKDLLKKKYKTFSPEIKKQLVTDLKNFLVKN